MRLEDGVLYCDLLSHWDERNWEAVQKYNPTTIDRTVFMELSGRYGGKLIDGRADEEILRSYQIFMSRGEDPALLSGG